jgi:hypothetical protein
VVAVFAVGKKGLKQAAQLAVDVGSGEKAAETATVDGGLNAAFI